MNDLDGILITNNPAVHEKYNEKMEIIFLKDADLMSVLHYARDRIHEGHKLLTHPLSGSVKPNQTPYKSIVVSKEKRALDMESLKLMEDSLAIARTGMGDRPTPDWTDEVRKDFQLIDLGLISSGLD